MVQELLKPNLVLRAVQFEHSLLQLQWKLSGEGGGLMQFMWCRFCIERCWLDD